MKKRDELIHKESKLEVGGIQVHPGHMAAMQGANKKSENLKQKKRVFSSGFTLAPMGQLGHPMMHHPMSHI